MHKYFSKGVSSVESPDIGWRNHLVIKQLGNYNYKGNTPARQEQGKQTDFSQLTKEKLIFARYTKPHWEKDSKSQGKPLLLMGKEDKHLTTPIHQRKYGWFTHWKGETFFNYIFLLFFLKLMPNFI